MPSRSKNIRHLQNIEEKKRLDTQIKERNRKRKVAKEVLFPVLYSTAKSIEDAKMFCTMVTASIRHAYGKVMMDAKLGELDLSKELNPKSPEYGRFKQVFDAFKDEKVGATLEIIDGASQLIDGCQKEEDSKRDLKSLEIKLL